MEEMKFDYPVNLNYVYERLTKSKIFILYLSGCMEVKKWLIKIQSN